ncbi:hypothetical protein B0T19DRAFT_147295 [Cercophora scortea]|uniref:Uncharacterized protein n=1 Tax=Cercophora scortea TaxID=314031 RepID=A0AAE0MIR5_9PEZI|nr:hypothetical protein B0T19DRAFT_147295 [Cercophora scortea]
MMLSHPRLTQLIHQWSWVGSRTYQIARNVRHKVVYNLPFSQLHHLDSLLSSRFTTHSHTSKPTTTTTTTNQPSRCFPRPSSPPSSRSPSPPPWPCPRAPPRVTSSRQASAAFTRPSPTRARSRLAPARARARTRAAPSPAARTPPAASPTAPRLPPAASPPASPRAMTPCPRASAGPITPSPTARTPPASPRVSPRDSLPERERLGPTARPLRQPRPLPTRLLMMAWK